MKRLLTRTGLLTLLGIVGWASAHPTPNSVVLLDVYEHVVQAEVQIPLVELGLALKANLPETTAGLSLYSEQLGSYLPQHIRPLTPDG